MALRLGWGGYRKLRFSLLGALAEERVTVQAYFNLRAAHRIIYPDPSRSFIIHSRLALAQVGGRQTTVDWRWTESLPAVTRKFAAGTLICLYLSIIKPTGRQCFRGWQKGGARGEGKWAEKPAWGSRRGSIICLRSEAGCMLLGLPPSVSGTYQCLIFPWTTHPWSGPSSGWGCERLHPDYHSTADVRARRSKDGKGRMVMRHCPQELPA